MRRDMYVGARIHKPKPGRHLLVYLSCRFKITKKQKLLYTRPIRRFSSPRPLASRAEQSRGGRASRPARQNRTEQNMPAVFFFWDGGDGDTYDMTNDEELGLHAHTHTHTHTYIHGIRGLGPCLLAAWLGGSLLLCLGLFSSSSMSVQVIHHLFIRPSVHNTNFS